MTTAAKKSLVVLGAGTAGTMVANKLRHRLPSTRWTITVVDRTDIHDYQPGYLFIPFGLSSPEQVRRARHAFIGDGIDLVLAEVDSVDPAARSITLGDGRALTYDYLVIASGTTPRPDQTLFFLHGRPDHGPVLDGRPVPVPALVEVMQSLPRALDAA